MSDQSTQTTPRQRSERELRDALWRYEAILSSALDPVITIDTHGIVQDASQSVERVFGWKLEELLGQNVTVLMPEPYRSTHDEYLAEYRRTGKTNIIGRPREFEAVRKNGTRLPIEVSVWRVNLPGKDQPLLTAILRDVTKHKIAERALREGEARLQAILDNTTAVVYVKDTQGHYLLINRRFEELFHITRHEIVGKTDYDMFPQDAAAVFRANDEQVLRHGAAVEFEETAPHDDGLHTYISVKFPLRDTSNVVYAICGISTDITARKKAEEELSRHRDRLEELVTERTAELAATHGQLRLADRLASIGTLAAGLGHDMNNVLLPIRSRLDALDATDLPDDVREHLEAVRKSTKYLQQLAEGLHLLALDPESADASNKATDLSDWWEQVGTLLARGLPKHVRLSTSWPRALPPLAVAPHRLTQAVLNLIVNAGEAIAEDGDVRVWAEPFEDRRFVRIGVTDNGHGMTAEVKRRALDPFFTTKKRGLGTGLGLSLVHGVARSAGGSVHIDSEPGKGTTLELILPTATQQRNVEFDETPHAMVSVSDQRIASFLEGFLRASGFEVHTGPTADPGSCRVWITEPSEAAFRFLRGSLKQSQVVLVVGPASNKWTDLGATLIEDPSNLEEIREQIGRVFSMPKGETP